MCCICVTICLVAAKLNVAKHVYLDGLTALLDAVRRKTNTLQQVVKDGGGVLEL